MIFCYLNYDNKMTVSLIMDLNNDVLDIIKNLYKCKELIIKDYVNQIYYKSFKNLMNLIYYYLRFDNKNINSYLLNKTKLIKIYKKFNTKTLLLKSFDEYKFYEIIDDIIEKYNRKIYELLEFISDNKNIKRFNINIKFNPNEDSGEFYKYFNLLHSLYINF